MKQIKLLSNICVQDSDYGFFIFEVNKHNHYLIEFNSLIKSVILPELVKEQLSDEQ